MVYEPLDFSILKKSYDIKIHFSRRSSIHLSVSYPKNNQCTEIFKCSIIAKFGPFQLIYLSAYQLSCSQLSKYFYLDTVFIIVHFTLAFLSRNRSLPTIKNLVFFRIYIHSVFLTERIY